MIKCRNGRKPIEIKAEKQFLKKHMQDHEKDEIKAENLSLDIAQQIARRSILVFTKRFSVRIQVSGGHIPLVDNDANGADDVNDA